MFDNENAFWSVFWACITVMVVFATFQVSSCSKQEAVEVTKRTEAVCAGDLKSDSARAIACAEVVSRRSSR